MTKDEALKLALEALVEMTPSGQTGSAIWNKQMSAITAASDALAQPEQEPVDFASLLREAEEIMQSKPTWKRFIDGTPLANDIAVWMAVFAQDVARRTSPPQRQPEERNFCPRCGKRTADLTLVHTCTPPIAADPKAFHGFPSGSVSTPNAGGKCVTAGETAPVRQIDPNAWAFDRGLEST
jgi:hypothetical protein